ncbi:DUF6340 family protein [Escherichia coli]
MKAIRTIGLLALLLITGACGPMINIMEVDVRLPATRPLNILGRNMAVFTPQYDSVSMTDSVLLNRFAQAFADGIASQALLPKGSVPLFSHYCGSEPLGTLDQPDYVHRLALETGTDLLFMVDSVTIGGFQAKDLYLIVPLLSVVRVYDTEQVRFIQYIPIRDTVAWEFWIQNDQETIPIPKNAFVDLQKAAVYLGERTARSFVDQWETQDRVVFVYDKRVWNKAYDHALAFEWDKAMDIWLELLEGPNVKEIACAAFNLALACEMQGNFELAGKWLELSQKTFDMPETRYYMELLQERNKQSKLF